MTTNCMDCGLLDDQMPLDIVLTGDQWKMISPEEGGILCGACIIKRASRLPNVINVCARIIFSVDYADSVGAGGKFWQMMKALDEQEHMQSKEKGGGPEARQASVAV